MDSGDDFVDRVNDSWSQLGDDPAPPAAANSPKSRRSTWSALSELRTLEECMTDADRVSPMRLKSPPPKIVTRFAAKTVRPPPLKFQARPPVPRPSAGPHAARPPVGRSKSRDWHWQPRESAPPKATRGDWHWVPRGSAPSVPQHPAPQSFAKNRGTHHPIGKPIRSARAPGPQHLLWIPPTVGHNPAEPQGAYDAASRSSLGSAASLPWTAGNRRSPISGPSSSFDANPYVPHSATARGVECAPPVPKSSHAAQLPPIDYSVANSSFSGPRPRGFDGRAARPRHRSRSTAPRRGNFVGVQRDLEEDYAFERERQAIADRHVLQLEQALQSAREHSSRVSAVANRLGHHVARSREGEWNE